MPDTDTDTVTTALATEPPFPLREDFNAMGFRWKPGDVVHMDQYRALIIYRCATEVESGIDRWYLIRTMGRDGYSVKIERIDERSLIAMAEQQWPGWFETFKKDERFAKTMPKPLSM